MPQFLNHVTHVDATNISLGTAVGTKIGTATNQKVAFYNATPVVQPSGDALAALSNLGLVSAPTLGNLFDFMVPLVNAPIAITTTANLTYGTMNVCSGTSAYNVTLPTPAAGKLLGIRMAPLGSSAGQLNKLVTILPHAAETIDGASSRIMWAGEFAVLYSDGTNWFKLFGRSIPLICVMGRTAAFNLPSGSATNVPMDTTIRDNSGLMADPTVNNRITIVRPAQIHASGTMVMNPITANVNVIQTQITVNGTTGSLNSTGGNYSAIYVGANVSAESSGTAGDYWNLTIYHNIGASQGLYVAPGAYVNSIMVWEISSW